MARACMIHLGCRGLAPAVGAFNQWMTRVCSKLQNCLLTLLMNLYSLPMATAIVGGLGWGFPVCSADPSAAQIYEVAVAAVMASKVWALLDPSHATT